MEFDLHNKLSQLFPRFFKTIICSSALSDQLDFPHVTRVQIPSSTNLSDSHELSGSDMIGSMSSLNKFYTVAYYKLLCLVL